VLLLTSFASELPTPQLCTGSPTAPHRPVAHPVEHCAGTSCGGTPPQPEPQWCCLHHFLAKTHTPLHYVLIPATVLRLRLRLRLRLLSLRHGPATGLVPVQPEGWTRHCLHHLLVPHSAQCIASLLLHHNSHSVTASEFPTPTAQRFIAVASLFAQRASSLHYHRFR
jgi:hypothetical protein